MDIKIEDLHTFLVINEQGTFSKASSILGLSQSALSQKIAKLEETLHAVLFIRNPRSLSLTSAGEELLIYAKDATDLQNNFISKFNQYGDKLTGNIRLASFSSIMRSRVVKALEDFMVKNPNVSIEYQSYEMHELENVLKSNQADLIITDYKPVLSRINQRIIGVEEYIIIESNNHKNIPNVYFDHSSLDNATTSYFEFQNKKKNYERKYIGDVYGIIDFVVMGLGRAVMSKHLVESDSRLKLVKSSKKYQRNLVLSYFDKNYYSPLQVKVLELLSSI